MECPTSPPYRGPLIVDGSMRLSPRRQPGTRPLRSSSEEHDLTITIPAEALQYTLAGIEPFEWQLACTQQPKNSSRGNDSAESTRSLQTSTASDRSIDSPGIGSRNQAPRHPPGLPVPVYSPGVSIRPNNDSFFDDRLGITRYTHQGMLRQKSLDRSKHFVRYLATWVELNENLFELICPADLSDMPCLWDERSSGCDRLRLCNVVRRYPHPRSGVWPSCDDSSYCSFLHDIMPTCRSLQKQVAERDSEVLRHFRNYQRCPRVEPSKSQELCWFGHDLEGSRIEALWRFWVHVYRAQEAGCIGFVRKDKDGNKIWLPKIPSLDTLTNWTEKHYYHKTPTTEPFISAWTFHGIRIDIPKGVYLWLHWRRARMLEEQGALGCTNETDGVQCVTKSLTWGRNDHFDTLEAHKASVEKPSTARICEPFGWVDDECMQDHNSTMTALPNQPRARFSLMADEGPYIGCKTVVPCDKEYARQDSEASNLPKTSPTFVFPRTDSGVSLDSAPTKSSESTKVAMAEAVRRRLAQENVTGNTKWEEIHRIWSMAQHER